MSDMVSATIERSQDVAVGSAETLPAGGLAVRVAQAIETCCRQPGKI